VQNGAGDHLIVVESKIDSTAMWGQLEKYEKDLTHRLEQTPPDGLGATLRLTSPEMEIRLQIRHGKAPADGEERRGQSPLSSGKSKAIRKPEIAI
jgi:hypothetical protein